MRLFKLLISFIFVLFILIHVMYSVEIVEHKARFDRFSLFSYDTINVFEPFPVIIEIHDSEYRSAVNGIKFPSPDDCGPSFFQRIGFEEYELEELEDEDKFVYKFPEGDDIVDFYVSVLPNGALSSSSNQIRCSISLNFDHERLREIWNAAEGVHIDTGGTISFRLNLYDFNFGVKNEPEGFDKQSERFQTDYIKTEDDLDFRIRIGLADGSSYSYDDLVNGDVHITDGSQWARRFSPDLYDIERYNFELGDGHFAKYCASEIDSYNERSESNHYSLRCHYYVTVITPISPVTIDSQLINRWEYGKEPHERDRVLNQVEDLKNEVRYLLLRMGDEIYFESDGENVELEIERELVEEEQYCGNCFEGYVCSACDECIKEDDAIDPDDVDVELDVLVAHPEEEILNSYMENALFRIYPNAKLFYDGNQIDYCDIKEPGIEMSVEAILDEDEIDVYSGFTLLGRFDDERKLEDEKNIDLERDNPYALFILSPNDRTKYFHEVGIVEQNITFNVIFEGEEISEDNTSVYLIPPDEIVLDLSPNRNVVHQGSYGVLNMKVNGGSTPSYIMTQTRLLGPGKIGTDGRNIIEEWILEILSSGDTFQISYHAPEMGNFDIGNALSSLSMVDLQREAAKQIVQDALSSYAGSQIKQAGRLADAGELAVSARNARRISQFSNAYQIYSNVDKIAGVPSNLQDIYNETEIALGGEEGAVEAGWVERGANLGVAGISATQTAVSLVTFFPNRIPAVRRLTSQFDTAFSAATNIWKANLKYVAESEKIERAQEIYYPVPILVTAKDRSGWTVQDMHIFQIAYHQVN